MKTCTYVYYTVTSLYDISLGLKLTLRDKMTRLKIVKSLRQFEWEGEAIGRRGPLELIDQLTDWDRRAVE